jgi:hypothetical protein
VVVVLLDRASFVGRDDDESRAQLAAARHGLAEYDVSYRMIRAGDDLATALGGQRRGERVRA